MLLIRFGCRLNMKLTMSKNILEKNKYLTFYLTVCGNHAILSLLEDDLELKYNGYIKEIENGYKNRVETKIVCG